MNLCPNCNGYRRICKFVIKKEIVFHCLTCLSEWKYDDNGKLIMIKTGKELLFENAQEYPVHGC
jgi:hypothetical protein